MRSRPWVLKLPQAAAAVMIGGLFLLSCAAPPAPAIEPRAPAEGAAPPSAMAPGQRRVYRGPESLSDVFERVTPAVVVILTESRRLSKERPAQEDLEISIGTGFIVSPEGMLMTASHLIEVADRIVVRFHDGWEEEAEVVAAAPMADVALIRLKHIPENLQVAEIGDSDRMRTGDPIFVVGSPYGIEYTLSAGHISGRREQSVFSPEVAPIVQLQTDAAINQGNSGGPMFNMAGEVVGVVSHILTRSGGFEGLGFALSINTAREILLNQTAFWTGVEFYPLAGPLARALNVAPGGGLLVQRVALNAPARRLGIRPGTIPVTVGGDEFFIGGDVVVSINGIAVNPADAARMFAIRQAINQLPMGGRIEIEVIRDGNAVTLATTK